MSKSIPPRGGQLATFSFLLTAGVLVAGSASAEISSFEESQGDRFESATALALELAEEADSIPRIDSLQPGVSASFDDLDLSKSDEFAQLDDFPSLDQLAEADARVETEILNPSAAAPNSTSHTPLNAILTDEIVQTFDDEMAQLITVSDLSDVLPTDWAWEAVRSLAEQQGCLAGYPDGTFRGSRAMGRYEFAALVNACLDSIDYEALDPDSDVFPSAQRLTEEFESELAAVEDRVDELEANQFSTTTRLFGQVVAGLHGRTDADLDLFPVDGTPDPIFDDPANQIGLLYNVQLSLLTQFNSRTILLTGLQAGEGGTRPSFASTYTGLSFEGNTGSDIQLSDLTLRHLVTDDFAIIAGPRGVSPVNVFRGANRVESAGFGPISAFAQRNPIIAIGSGQGGFGIDWQITDRVSLQAVYTSSDPESPNVGGLFGGSNNLTTTGVQLTLAPIDNLDIALHYLNSYSPSGSLNTGIGDSQLTLGDSLQTNAFGGTIAWQLNPDITLGGWTGFTTSQTPGETGSVETFNWMTFLNFPDLGGEGHLGGIYFGQPPRITSSDLRQGQNIPGFAANAIGDPGGREGTTLHLEGFYRYALTDNIALTPGIIFIFDPVHASASENIVIGALRTTFTF